MAWHIHDQQKQHPDQKNFISFVGRDHLLNVAKHLTIFINDENQFNSYKQPANSITDTALTTDETMRTELLKTFALATTVYEEEVWAEKDEIPFIHHSELDMPVLAKAEQELRKRISLVDMFEDMEGLGVTLGKEDLIPEAQMKESLRSNAIPDKEALLKYLESAKGGGGIAKCYPMGYVQGNFTNYHLSVKEEVEE